MTEMHRVKAQARRGQTPWYKPRPATHSERDLGQVNSSKEREALGSLGLSFSAHVTR